MADLHSAQTLVTVRLPADLINERTLLSQENGISFDEVVREACVAFSEPHVWERCYRESVES